MTSDARRVAVIGGAGFVGSHLVERLVADGDEVLVVDDLSSGRLDSLADARRVGRVGFHSLDVDHPEFRAVLARFRPDLVLLLVRGRPSDGGVADPVGTVTSLMTRVAGLCETCLAAEARLVVCTRVADLYGTAAEPARETRRPRPLHPYGAAVYAALRYVEARMGDRWCAVATVPVYGPRNTDDDGPLADRVLRSLLAGTAPTVHGGPEDAADHLYVTDVVDGLVRAGAHGHGLVNLGTGVPVRADVIVDRLARAVGAGFDADAVRWRPQPTMTPSTCSVDPATAATRLDWQPSVSLNDGVARTLEWVRANPPVEPGRG